MGTKNEIRTALFLEMYGFRSQDLVKDETQEHTFGSCSSINHPNFACIIPTTTGAQVKGSLTVPNMEGKISRKDVNNDESNMASSHNWRQGTSTLDG
jgi:hypothetical protein